MRCQSSRNWSQRYHRCYIHHIAWNSASWGACMVYLRWSSRWIWAARDDDDVIEHHYRIKWCFEVFQVIESCAPNGIVDIFLWRGVVRKDDPNWGLETIWMHLDHIIRTMRIQLCTLRIWCSIYRADFSTNSQFDMQSMFTYLKSFPYNHSCNIMGVQLLRHWLMVMVEVKLPFGVTISWIADLPGIALARNLIHL
jgi:hypothetical protein